MAGTPETPIPAPVANFSNTTSIDFSDDNSCTATCALSGITLPGPTGYTYSLWIQSTNFALISSMEILVMHYTSSITDKVTSLSLNGTSKQLKVEEFEAPPGTGDSEELDPTPLTNSGETTRWYQVCVTSTSTTLTDGIFTLYVNGVSVASGGGQALSAVTDITIRPPGGLAPSLMVDEVAIWDAPLSAAQVATLYTNASGRGGKASDVNDIGITSTAAPRIWNTSKVYSGTGPAYDSYAIDSDTIFVAYTVGGAGTPGKGLYFAKSTDGGAGWTTSTIDTNGQYWGIVSIFAVDSNTIFIGYNIRPISASDDALGFAKSTDGGSNWTVSTPGLNEEPRQGISVFATDANTIFISYYDHVLQLLRFAKSTDGGASFTFATIESSAGKYSDLYALDSSNIFISYQKSGGTPNETIRLAKSTNGGTSWTLSDISATNGGASSKSTTIWAVDINTIYASYVSSTYSVALAKSINGGSTWTVSTPPFVGTTSSQSLAVLDANNIAISYVVASSNDVVLGVSLNGGGDWISEVVSTSSASFGVPLLYAVSSSTYYIVYSYYTTPAPYTYFINCATSSVNSALRIWWRMGDLPDDTEGDPGYIYNAAPVPDNRLEISADVNITTPSEKWGPASNDRFQITTPENSGTGLVPRVLNQNSVTFDGVNQSYSSSIGVGPDFTVGGDGMTLNCNVKLNSITGIQPIFGQANIDSTGTHTAFMIYMFNATLTVIAADSASGDWAIMGIVGGLVTGVWYTVTVTLAPGGNMIGYLWGTQYGTPAAISAGFGATWSANKCWSIGAWREGTVPNPSLRDFSNIQVDECTVFNLAMSQLGIIRANSKIYYRPDWSTPPIDYMTEFEGKLGYPLAWWRMGDTAGDSATRMFDATGTWGNEDSAAFDGSDDGYLSDSTTYYPKDTARTVTWWQKGAGASGTYVWDFANQHAYFFGPNFYVSGYGLTSLNGTSVRSSTVWQHWAVVLTSAGWNYLYMNGVERDKNEVNLTTYNETSSLGIACNNAGAAFCPISIDEVAFWEGTALTQPQVAEIYNTGSALDMTTFTGTAPTHWYRMGDDPGDSGGASGVLVDQMGNLDFSALGAPGPVIEEDVPGQATGNTLTGSGLSASDIQDEIPIIYFGAASQNAVGGPYFAAPTIITPIQVPYVNPVPVLASSSPPSGTTDGGTTITITGINLNGVVSVVVGGVFCTSPTSVSATSITAVTSASTAGVKDIVVTTVGGYGTLSNAFTYAFNIMSIAQDGIDDYVKSELIPQSELDGEVSMSCWLKVTTENRSEFGMSIGAGTNFSHFKLYMGKNQAQSGNPLGWKAGQGNGHSTVQFQLITSPAPTPGWHHIALTDSSTSSSAGVCKVYVDAVEAYEFTSIQWAAPVYQVHYAVNKGMYNEEWEGNTDEWAIWDRVLSPTQVSELFDNGPTDLSTMTGGGPLHWWRMGDEISGTTCPDQGSGTALDLDLYNGATTSTDVPT